MRLAGAGVTDHADACGVSSVASSTKGRRQLPRAPSISRVRCLAHQSFGIAIAPSRSPHVVNPGPCATRQGWSRGNGVCDDPMKPCLSSSGCETRPAKGEPARPVASLAPKTVTDSAKRRHASEWAVGHAATKGICFRVTAACGAAPSHRAQSSIRHRGRGPAE